MLDNFQKDVCVQALLTFGEEHQINKSIEEMTELITELTRIHDNRTIPEKIIIDVPLPIPLVVIFGESAVEREIQKKILRLQAGIDIPPLGERHSAYREDGHVLPLIHDDFFKD